MMFISRKPHRKNIVRFVCGLSIYVRADILFYSNSIGFASDAGERRR
jgi:hypothetical protein